MVQDVVDCVDWLRDNVHKYDGNQVSESIVFPSSSGFVVGSVSSLDECCLLLILLTCLHAFQAVTTSLNCL